MVPGHNCATFKTVFSGDICYCPKLPFGSPALRCCGQPVRDSVTLAETTDTGHRREQTDTMWPFSPKSPPVISANSVTMEDGTAVIDVRGQTCPGYLLAINKAVETLDADTPARLLITYPPCGEDVKAWAKERHIEYLGMEQQTNMWVIHIRK